MRIIVAVMVMALALAHLLGAAAEIELPRNQLQVDLVNHVPT